MIECSNWTGPDESDLEPDAMAPVLRETVPGARWPYGPPETHESCCLLHSGGLFCDCRASDASDLEWGMRL